MKNPTFQAGLPKNARSLVFDPFADDDFAANIDQVKNALNGIAGGGVCRIFIALTDKAHGIECGILRGPNKFKLHRALRVVHKALTLSK